MWPNAKISVMGSGQLSQVMSGISKDPTRHSDLQSTIEAQSTALYATARLWDDGIIKPTDSRDVLGLGLGLAKRQSMIDRSTSGRVGRSTWDGHDAGFGVFRM